MDARLGGKRKRPGIFRAGRRQFWHVLADRLHRRHHPRIFARLAPAGERQPPRWPQRLFAYWRTKPRARQRTSRRTATPADQIWRDRTDTPWHRQARNRPAARRRDLPRPRQHRRRDVDAEHMADRAPSRANAIVVEPQPQPISTTRSPARPWRVDQEIGDRRQQDVLHRLPVGPALAGRTVPIGDLVGVLVVGRWLLHHGLIRRPARLGALGRRILGNGLGRPLRCARCPGSGAFCAGMLPSDFW